MSSSQTSPAAPAEAAASDAPALPADVLSSPLYNHDLAPTAPAQRTWSRWHIASLWIGMSVCVTTYTLAAGLLKLGMNWWQAVLTILLGNVVVLVPMVLNAHPGAKYGIPFPVLIRASFGTLGSNVPAIARAIVACGWFGIQTWIGGAAIFELLKVFFPAWKSVVPLAGVGISGPELGCFFAFWLINVYFIVRGTESIKWLETLSAPFLIAIGLALLAWGVHAGGGSLSKVLAESEKFTVPTAQSAFGDAFLTSRAPSRAASGFAGGGVVVTPLYGRAKEVRIGTGPWQPAADIIAISPTPKDASNVELRDGKGNATSVAIHFAQTARPSFWLLFFPSLTAMVGYWATLSLNIPDFTRFARSQRDQVLGQLYGLPTTMALYSFIGIAVTCASLLAFPDILVHEDAPWDPVRLLGRFTSPPLVIVSMIALLVATLTTNIAANVVSPANDFANVFPRRVSYLTGGLITAFIGIIMMPWKLIASTKGYIFTWLIGYGALLGPIAGIMIADYFVVRRTRLDVADLYRVNGRYGAVNVRTLAIFAVAVAPCVPGFLAEAFPATFAASVPGALRQLYTYAWFVGFATAFALHAAVAKREVSPNA